MATIATFSIKTNNLEIFVNSNHKPPLAEASFNLVVSGKLKSDTAGGSQLPAYIELKLRREEDGVGRVTNYEWFEFRGVELLTLCTRRAGARQYSPIRQK